MKVLNELDVTFAAASIVDPSGRVFFHEGRVFRAVYDADAAAFLARVLAAPWISEAFDAGLVGTWIASDVGLEGARLVLEHERVPFTVTPAEFTSRMHWQAAQTLLRVAATLARHGVYLKDAHPWNVLFHRGRAVLVDVGSLEPHDGARAAWLDEFRRTFAAPLWLASAGMTGFAAEYRRQHHSGFGLRLFDATPLRQALGLALGGARPGARSPERLVARLQAWVDRHEPRAGDRGRWGGYEQSGASEDPLTPTSPKQAFVLDALSAARPATVLDCAANKGYYSEMAAALGAAVVAFDYEERCVDACLALAQRKALDLTPAVMDFKLPTPPSGWGLACGSSIERFGSEIVLALGLCHHLCLAQGVPVRLFAEVCMAYASRGVVMEYVDPADAHVARWGQRPPPDYSVDGFTRHFSRKFPQRRVVPLATDGGLRRTMLFFHR